MKQRTMKITKNIICMTSILVLFILIKPTKVYAFSMNEARNSPVLTSQYRTTRLRNEYDVKLFQVQMPKSGCFRITLRPNAVADENDIGHGWNLKIYRKDDLKEPVKQYWQIENKMVTEKLVLTSGTYYIEVKSYSEYGMSPIMVPFDIKADVVSENNWEQENNNTFKKANKISIGKKYQGTLFDDIDEDWFKVVAPNTGRITATLNCDPDTDVNDVGDGWDVSVYSASDINTEIVKEEGIITKGSVRFNAVKGRTYYIYVHSYHYSFPEGYTYQLATSFKGPKATPAKKTTNTSKKPVKMVTGVSLKVKKKEIRRIQIRRQRVQRKIPGIPGKMKVDLIWKALQWLLLLPNIPLWEKAMYPYRKWSIILTDQDELIRLQHWQQEGRILSRHFARFIMKRQLQKESDRKLPMYRQ